MTSRGDFGEDAVAGQKGKAEPTSTADLSLSLVFLWILHFQPEASKKKSPPW